MVRLGVADRGNATTNAVGAKDASFHRREALSSGHDESPPSKLGAAAPPCLPVGLVAEFLENPICLETRTPRLSWRLDDSRAGARQTAYRIAAASSAARLEAGENVLGAMLADGWFAGTMVWPDHRCHYGKRTAFLAQLEVEFADGTRQVVVSNDSWRYTERGPVRDADHYNGETYDARLETPGWDAPGFTARGWRLTSVSPRRA